MDTPDASEERAPDDPAAPASGRRRALRLAGRAIAVLVALTLAVAAVLSLWLWLALRASLPTLDGTIDLAGLSAPVRVERDALGVPLLRGATRLDVARGTGFEPRVDRLRQTATGPRAGRGAV